MTEQRDIDRQRDAVRQHLDELESRINPKKLANRLIGKAQDSYNDDPTPWIAAAAGAAVLVAGGLALALFGRK